MIIEIAFVLTGLKSKTKNVAVQFLFSTVFNYFVSDKSWFQVFGLLCYIYDGI